MSIEQQVEQSIPPSDPAIQAVYAEMTDGRRIGIIRPQGWRNDIKEAVPAALAELAGMQASLADATDEQIGMAFFTALQRRCSVTRVAPTEFGAYLRQKAGMVTGKPLEPFPYPDGGSEAISGHEGNLANLRIWADDTTDDVLSGVDEQARMLIVRDPRAWPNDGCQTSAAAKAFLGRVMDYKRARLAPLVPQDGMRLLVDSEMNQGAYFVLGTVVRVGSVGSRNYTAYGDCDFGGDGSIDRDQSQSMRTSLLRQYHLVAEDLPEPSSGPEPEAVIAEAEAVVTESIETNAVVAALNQTITDQRGSISRLEEQLAREQDAHRRDIDRIGTFLIQKANDRGWCSEYDEGIEYLNRDLSIQLPLRRQDVEVEVSGYVRMPYSVTVTVTVDGDCDDDTIRERAGEIVENNYAARSLINDYGDAYSAEVEDDMEFEFESPE